MTQPDIEHEKVSDESDRATQIEMGFTEDAIHEAQRKAKPQQLPRGDGTYEVTDCDDCGEPIGEKRLRVAVFNRICIVCATKREHRNFIR